MVSDEEEEEPVVEEEIEEDVIDIIVVDEDVGDENENIKLITIPYDKKIDDYKLEHLIESSLDTFKLSRRDMLYLNTANSSVSSKTDYKSVIKTFMNIPPTSPIQNKKIYICQISNDELSPHLTEMCDLVGAITGMDVVLIPSMKIQLQNNSLSLVYRNVKFNISMKEFDIGYSLNESNIIDIMNIVLFNDKVDIQSVFFISSHLFHNDSGRKRDSIYNFISTHREFDSLNKIVFNVCMRLLVKVIKSTGIQNCSVYRCLMNKNDTTDSICPICRYSLYNKTGVSMRSIVNNVNKLNIDNRGLNAMLVKYSGRFNL